MQKNIILIGMPGSGKSTVGNNIASRWGFKFIDTDFVITDITGKTPKEIVADNGREFFLKIQDDAVCGIKNENQVIATGGSVVLSEVCMEHLKKIGVIVFLKINFESMIQRLAPDRKLARSADQSLYAMYTGRLPLYEKYADIIIDCEGKSVHDIANEVIQCIQSNQKYKGV